MILLTGTSGFIGKHLLSALIKRYGAESVIALTSKPIEECSYILHSDYHFEKDHFEKAGFADSINTIIHAGAFTPKNNTKSNDWHLSNSNIFSTDKLLKATLPKLQKFIFLSTLDVYGKNEIISEASLVEPASLYGYSKLYCEKMITSWVNTENKIFQLLRVGHVYGPGEEAYHKIIPVTIKKLIVDEPLQLWGSGEELRAFIYINDVVLAILNSLELKKSAGIINLVSAHTISISQLINKLIEISGKKPVIEIVAGTAGRNLIFDNAKLKGYLLESETSLDEGLLKEWQYMNLLNN